MTAAAFHPCRLQTAYLRKAPSCINLFAADRKETFTFEDHENLPAERMKSGEALAEKAINCLPDIPVPLITAATPGIPSGPAGEISCDVLVCGGGTAGALAAIAAGRSGVKTHLWEAMDYLGGVGTGGALNGYYYGLPGGLQDEVDQRVAECEKLLYGRHAGHRSRFMRFHPFAKMIVLEEMAEEANVTIEYGKMVYGVETRINNPENLPDNTGSNAWQNPCKKLEAVEAVSENGLFRCRASVFIDSTGDGDVAVFAGASYTAGREPDAIQHIFSIPAIYLAACEEKDENGQLICHYRSLFPINMDAGYCDACDPWDVSRARIAGILGFDAPEFNEDGHVLFFSAVLGARASRQIQGDYKLGLSDQIRASEFPDLIAYSASHYDNHAQDYENESLNAMLWTWALDAHNEPIGCEIPYRTMLPQGIDNLLVACRSLSLEFDANLQFRMQRDMQRIGEAAGIAAAFTVKDGTTLRTVNIRKVQDKLFETNALKSPETHYHCLDWKPEKFYPDRRLVELDETGYHLAKNLLPSARDTYRLLEEQLDNSNPGIRYCSALKMSVISQSPKALNLLLQCIRERCKEVPPDSWRFRTVETWKIAIAVCGALQFTDAREELEKILKDPECRQDPQVLILTVRALGKIGNRHSAGMIRELVSDQSIPHTQIFFKWSNNDHTFKDDCRWKLDLAAYESMYRLGEPMPELIEKYRQDIRGYVRQALNAVESRLKNL